MIYSDKTLSQKLERTEARSNANFVEARARVMPESGVEWTEVGGVYAMFDGAESPLTQTFGLGVFDAITETEMERLESFFVRRGAPVFHEVSPLADASVLTLLNERGYQPVELTSVMFQPISGVAENDSPPVSNITTRVIEAGEEEIWARTSASGWAAEMPELGEFMFGFGKISAQCAGGFPFVAEIADSPIAAGMLFIYDDVALLAGASTVPENRRLGAQSALLAARLKFAAEKGLHAGDDGRVSRQRLAAQRREKRFSPRLHQN
jgi:hypothetical protein